MQYSVLCSCLHSTLLCKHALLLLLLCCLQAPFTIVKTGPTNVIQNEPFQFEVIVVIMSNAKGLRVVDNLPTGLWPTGTASWTSILSAGSAGPGGSECTFHKSAMLDTSPRKLQRWRLRVLLLCCVFGAVVVAGCVSSSWCVKAPRVVNGTNRGGTR
jgi:hypothetical protein